MNKVKDKSTSIEKELEKLEADSDEIKVTKTSPTWVKVIWADSGVKPLAEYRKHALNWDSTESTSRIIKGVEGILGNLDKAVIDIAVGVGQKINAWLKSMGEKRAE